MRRQHVERARHGAETARRRYLAVDPDNRLVAANLEADWNDSLRALAAAQDEYERQTARATPLADADKARIAALATDFPALWSDPRTPQRERKRMVRLLIDDVTLDAKTKSSPPRCDSTPARRPHSRSPLAFPPTTFGAPLLTSSPKSTGSSMITPKEVSPNN